MTEFAVDLADWPDPEVLVKAVLADLPVAGLTVDVDVPPDPAGTYSWLPFLRVQCHGGSNLDRVTELFRFDVDAFGSSRRGASQLAGAARQRLLNCPIVTTVGLLDRVTTSARPFEVPYGDVTRVRRYTASYAGRARRAT